MPDMQYPKNSNSDTAFVVQEGGQKNRVLMTVEDNDGTVEYSDSPNSTNAYVTIDGKKHRALLTAPQDTSTLEMSDNPNSTKGYVTVDGKKHRVVLTATIAGGGTPINNQDISVTANGEYTAEEGYTGLGTVSVSVPNPSTGTKNITANGVYDVTDFASADVNVPGAPAHYLTFSVDENGEMTRGTPFMDFTGVKKISGDYLLAYAAYASRNFTEIDFGDIEETSGGNCLAYFATNSYIEEVNFPKLKVIKGISAFSNAFYNSHLKNIYFPSLEQINSNQCFTNAFSNSKLESISFPKLSKIDGTLSSGSYDAPFGNCRNLGSVSFGGVKASTFSNLGRLQYLFGSTTGSTAPNGCTVHFPSNFDPSDPNHTFDITTLAGYPTFGGGASYIHLAFDLPATE